MRTQPLLATALLVLAFAGCLDDRPAPQSDGPVTQAVVELSDAASDAPSFMDVQRGRMTETASALIIEVQVGEIDPKTLKGKMDAAGIQDAFVGICWNPGERPNTFSDCAGVILTPSSQPYIGAYDYYYGPEDGCNDWYWCTRRVTEEVTPGSPGTFKVTVPREYLPNASKNTTLADPSLYSTRWLLDPSNVPYSTLGRGAAVTACAMGCRTVGASPRYTWAYDTAEAGQDFVLQLDTVPSLAPISGKTILRDGEGDVRLTGLGYRPEYDLLSVDIEETATEVAYLVKIANLPQAANHEFDMELAVGGVVYEAWYSSKAGLPMDLGGGYCVDVNCDEWRDITPTVRITPGTPGTVRIGLQWSELLPLKPGQFITLAEAEIGEPSFSVYQRVGPGSVRVSSAGMWDGAWYVEPYALVQGTPK